jgi:hypothetical protein
VGLHSHTQRHSKHERQRQQPTCSQNKEVRSVTENKWKPGNYKDSDSVGEITPIAENVKVQLEWIKRIQDQVDFANNPDNDVLPDFWIRFKVELRKGSPPL